MLFLRFQSTPVISDGRAILGGPVKAALLLFQSTPVISDGRASLSSLLDAQRLYCFNPRPSFLTGEPSGTLVIGNAADVSIHARHF